jgi:hypothetical protein
MTKNQAKAILAIVETADNGCVYCVNDLKKQLAAAFPDFDWEIKEIPRVDSPAYRNSWTEVSGDAVITCGVSDAKVSRG